MSDEISEAAKERAVALVNEIRTNAISAEGLLYSGTGQAFARYIQRVSDAANAAMPCIDDTGTQAAHRCYAALKPFILPDPVDPLLIEAREIMAAHTGGNNHIERMALAALKRGIELGQSK